jgi:hypothetical protein
VKVILLQHVRETEDGGEDVKVLGIFSTTQAVDDAISMLMSQPGFSDSPEGFQVDDYELDEVQWTKGFVVP